MKAKFCMAALFRYSEIGARMPLKPYSGRSVTSIINIFQLITEAHSQSLSAQQQGGQWNALVDGANGSIMETVKVSLRWYRKTNIAEVLSIWLGKRESLKGFWADGLAHLGIFFFNMAVGCHLPSLCSGMCWPRSIQPRPDTGDWAVGRKALGLVRVCLTHVEPVWRSRQGTLPDSWNLEFLQETAFQGTTRTKPGLQIEWYSLKERKEKIKLQMWLLRAPQGCSRVCRKAVRGAVAT